jgi:membrane-bound lytic murein transglycosylase B
MLSRRVLLSAAPAAAITTHACAAAGAADFGHFLAGVREEALHASIRPEIVAAALRITRNARVIELSRNQPEFTLTWAQYRARVLPEKRLAAARDAFGRNASLITTIANHYGVDARVIVGIWGLESNFGSLTGGFGVVESLATLAYASHRAAYFRGELINALRILNAGDISPAAMTGSWAGAMGQPQFMPSSFLRYAVDWNGDGRRDIWTSPPDVFASIANYLAKCGWHPGVPWGQPVTLPPGYAATSDRDRFRTLGDWMRDGIRRADGTQFSRTDPKGALVLPDGQGGQAFLVYDNFRVIRRYNPSDFYALAVGLLGNAAT